MHNFKNIMLQAAVNKILNLFQLAKDTAKRIERYRADYSNEKYLQMREAEMKAFNAAKLGTHLAVHKAEESLQNRAKELKSARIKPTDDAQLLQMAQTLTADELALVIERNAGNDFFIRVAHEYANKNSLDSVALQDAMNKHYSSIVDYDEAISQISNYLAGHIPADTDVLNPSGLQLLENEFNILLEDGRVLAHYDAMF